MKKDIHPEEYRMVVFMDAGADFKFLSRSTVTTKETIEWEDGNEYPLVRLDVSSASHPFYTGKQRFVDTAGRVEKFQQRFAWKEDSTKSVIETQKEEREARRKELAEKEEEDRKRITSRKKANEERRRKLVEKKKAEHEAKAAEEAVKAEAEKAAAAKAEAGKPAEAKAEASAAAADAPKAEAAEAPKTDAAAEAKTEDKKEE